MRKSSRKSIVGGITAFSLILTGTGYAYWTDTLNVTTRATTGELDVAFKDLGIYAQYEDEALEGWRMVEKSLDRPYKAEVTKFNNAGFNAELTDGKISGKDMIADSISAYGTEINGSGEIAVKLDNMYPGYAQIFRSDILNQGTIPARLGSLKFDIRAAEGKFTTGSTKVLSDKYDSESQNNGAVISINLLWDQMQ